MLLVDARVTQSVFAKIIPVSIPYNTTLTALDVARSMEQEAPLNAFDGLSLVSPPPSEALEPIAVLPGSQPDSLHMTWSLPPDRQAGQLLQTLLDRLSNLEDKSQATDQKISNLEESLAQTLPLSDAIHLQSLLDVWLHENGYGVTSGSRKTWIENNKIRLATVSGIPVGDLEDFLERFRSLGNTMAHVVKSDGVARAITRVTGNTNDELHFNTLFKSILQHTVIEELDKDQLFVTILNPGRDVDPTDRMKEIPKV